MIRVDAVVRVSRLRTGGHPRLEETVLLVQLQEEHFHPHALRISLQARSMVPQQPENMNVIDAGLNTNKYVVKDVA